MVEVLLADALAQRGVDARVHSAGLLAPGRPASEHSATLMADRGLDLSRHRSRTMTEDLLGGADLVIGMERLHVQEAAVLVREAWPRSFTLRELARRVGVAGPRPVAVPLDEWLRTLSEDRTPADHLGSSADDDVADPYGRSLRAYRRCADDLVGLVDTVVDGLWPVPTAAPTDPTADPRSTLP